MSVNFAFAVGLYADELIWIGSKNIGGWFANWIKMRKFAGHYYKPPYQRRF